MSPSLIATHPAGPRTDPITGHTYAIPIVRELPIPPADPRGDRGW